MIKKYIHNALLGNTVQSVQIHLGTDDKEYILVEMRKQKNDLVITNRFSSNDFDEFVATLSKNKPVILAFTGQGVVSKKVHSDANYQSKILFNADPEDFYWYEYRQHPDNYVSVARKELVTREIGLFTKEQIAVVDFCLGSFVIVGVKPLLEATEIQTRDTQLFFDHEQLINFGKRADDTIREYAIGGEKFSDSDIVCVAHVLNYLYPNEAIVSETASLAGSSEEFKYKKAFQALGVFTLLFFLVSLLISYFLLGYYQQAHHQIQVALGQQNIAYSKLVSLEKDKENKTAILTESGLRDSNFLSFYISEITKEVPVEIRLKLVSVFPTTSKIKSAQKINFTNDLIEIEGTVTSYAAFTSWIKELKKQPWIGHLEIVDFQREHRTNSFKIKLILTLDV